MNSFIKKFIENYINIIEANEWEHVFLNWYNTAEEVWPDSDVFKEFIEVLNNAGITPDMSKRFDVLYDELLYELMYDMRNHKKSTNIYHIGRFALLNKLHSTLGYTDEEVHKIMDDVAKSLNMTYTDYYGGGYTWK